MILFKIIFAGNIHRMYVYMCYCIYVFFIILFAILARLCFLMFFKSHQKTNIQKSDRSTPVKTLIVLGSGGHTAEILRVVGHLDFSNYSPRIYVHAYTDKLSADKVQELEVGQTDYRIMQVYRSREVKQSYLTSICTTIYSTLNCIPILYKERPELILCNGPGTCVPICVVAFIFNAFYITNTVLIFIESFCRVKTLSLTGKLLYFLVDHMIVQWPFISKPKYNRNVLI